MKRLLSVASLLSCNLACGELPEGEGTRVAFTAHALACEVPGMQAWLEVTGVEGVCPLTVASDRTVTGVCSGVPGGAERVFRIVYFVERSGTRVQLASANTVVDLRDETGSTVPVDFSGAEIVTALDADGDGVSNIVEFCTGRDPLVRDD